MNLVLRWIPVIGLLFAGVLLCLWTHPFLWDKRSALQIALLWSIPVAAVAGVIISADAPWNLFHQARTWRPRRFWVVDIALFFVAFVVLTTIAFWLGRPVLPTWHDNHMYLLQARQYAAGHLWMPALQHPQFFETFYILVTPVYTGMYAPGTGLVYALGVLADVPWWVTTLTIASLTIVISWRVLGELFDPWAGLLGAIALLAMPSFRQASFIIQSHIVLLLIFLLCFYAWLQWRKAKRWYWLILIGVTAGFAAITRPFEATLFVFPVAIAMLLDLRGAPPIAWVKAIAIPVLCGLPFLGFEGVINHGITGSVFKTPMMLYSEQFLPGAPLVGVNANLRPILAAADNPKIPQKLDFIKQFYIPNALHYAQTSIPGRLLQRIKETVEYTAVLYPFLALMPIGLLVIRNRPRAVFLACIVTFIGGYTFYLLMSVGYAVQVTPMFVMLLLGAIFAVEERLNLARRAGRAISAALWLLIPAALVAGSPMMVRSTENTDFSLGYSNFAQARQYVLDTVDRPALVFSRYHRGPDLPHFEFVFNVDTPQPDSADVIFAHDLGAENIELIRYYAEQSPDRNVYLLTRSPDFKLTRIGTCGELAKSGATEPVSSP